MGFSGFYGHSIIPVLVGIKVMVVFLQSGLGHHSARNLTESVQSGDLPQANLAYRSSCCIVLPQLGQVSGIESTISLPEEVGHTLRIDDDLRITHRL